MHGSNRRLCGAQYRQLVVTLAEPDINDLNTVIFEPDIHAKAGERICLEYTVCIVRSIRGIEYKKSVRVISIRVRLRNFVVKAVQQERSRAVRQGSSGNEVQVLFDSSGSIDPHVNGITPLVAVDRHCRSDRRALYVDDVVSCAQVDLDDLQTAVHTSGGVFDGLVRGENDLLVCQTDRVGIGRIVLSVNNQPVCCREFACVLDKYVPEQVV